MHLKGVPINPRVWCIDLEMEQPSQEIIQIGVVVGDLAKGNIIEELDIKINIGKPLSQFIKDLTALKQSDIDNGESLGDAVIKVNDLIQRTHACKSPVVWGNGDLRCLKQQSQSLIKNSLIQGIHREVDIKTIHQLTCLSQGMSMQGGLQSACHQWGVEFKGRAHDALVDAKNTFFLAARVSKTLGLLPKLQPKP